MLLKVQRISLSSLFWQERLEHEDHPIEAQDVRVGGCLYVLDPEDVADGTNPVLDIRFFDGRHLRTNRLKFVATIPLPLLPLLPDNALVSHV